MPVLTGCLFGERNACGTKRPTLQSFQPTLLSWKSFYFFSCFNIWMPCPKWLRLCCAFTLFVISCVRQLAQLCLFALFVGQIKNLPTSLPFRRLTCTCSLPNFFLILEIHYRHPQWTEVYFTKLKEIGSNQKSANRSAQFRKEGNGYFSKHDNVEAFESYTKVRYLYTRYCAVLA